MISFAGRARRTVLHDCKGAHTTPEAVFKPRGRLTAGGCVNDLFGIRGRIDRARYWRAPAIDFAAWSVHSVTDR